MDNLTCEGIKKTYGEKEVLHGIDLTIEKHKIYGMIGRNGAGKTTLLSILSAQATATKGTVSVNGMPVWENRKALDCICFSREISTGIGNGSIGAVKVKDYLKAAAIYYPNWDQEMAEQLLEKFQLDKKQKLGKVSKGMLSMVTIIIALASKSEYTFLDEPVAGLDVIMREYFYKLLLEEYEKTDRTFLISTHIIEEAANIFEDILIIKDGKLIINENTQDLIDRAVYISGKKEDVDQATKGFVCHHEEINGRSKGVTVLLDAKEGQSQFSNWSKKGQSLFSDFDVCVQSVSLQNLFVALCGMGE